MSAPTDSKLGQILDQARPAIEAALAEAEHELDELNTKRHELEALIARTRKMLDAFETEEVTETAGATSPASVRLTLHEAMRLVLTENGNAWMTVHELADQINGRALYEKRDHSLVDPSQIHARANKYPAMFEKDGARVHLR